MMKQGLLLWPAPLLPPRPLLLRHPTRSTPISATLDPLLHNVEVLQQQQGLTVKERRQLRNERRERNATNWKEEVEEKLLKKPKKRYANWKDELNLDNLALLGPQWWCVRVSRVNSQETAERLARYLARNFPDMEFKVYAPAVHLKRKLKNGTISNKPKAIFPGCAFLWCVLNKELHDMIRECPGIGGFIGSKVGNTKRQINRPKPVSTVDIEAIFRQAKEEQEQADRAFQDEEQVNEEEEQNKEILKNEQINIKSLRNLRNSAADLKPKRKTRKGSKSTVSSPSTEEDNNHLAPGSSVRVLSGPFSEFKGNLKKLNLKSSQATVGFMLFGKESLVDLDVNQIVADT